MDVYEDLKAKLNYIERKGQDGNTIILKFQDKPNKEAEENIMKLLIESYENRIDVSQKIDKAEAEVV